MVVILRENYNEEQRDNLVNWLESLGITVHSSLGEHNTVLGLVGDTSGIDIDLIKALDIVEDVKRIQEPYKNANRKFHPEDTVVVIDEEKDIKIGGGNFQIIAGPCSVESEEQVCGIAQAVQKSGATLLRGGAFKPRTSPYAFQGLRAEGLKLLLEAKKLTGMPIVTEIMDLSQLPLFDDVDVIQVGARNMQNFELLKQLGHINKPILLKRGLASTLQELLMSAEYGRQHERYPLRARNQNFRDLHQKHPRCFRRSRYQNPLASADNRRPQPRDRHLEACKAHGLCSHRRRSGRTYY